MRGLKLKVAMSRLKNSSSICCNTPVESSSDENMSIDEPPVASSSDFWNAKYVDSSLDEDMEQKIVQKVWEKRNTSTVIPIVPVSSGFVESFLVV
ncbi:hypothetical protein NPIL_185641 [Nephila pilipes]|uniref:Uncharacterized protein n=1 Tax=Nephila pilipes TaxID=299642 RepID=A0A8X6N856_NEPPI|nr:hypothetical protein NPIL_185641 [Nephila pilipes]